MAFDQGKIYHEHHIFHPARNPVGIRIYHILELTFGMVNKGY